MNIQLQAYLSDQRMNTYKYRTDSKEKFSKQFLFEFEANRIIFDTREHYPDAHGS